MGPNMKNHVVPFGGRGDQNSARLIYILAASHSGSTLLSMLLGSHPDICTVGEIKLGALGNVDEYLCSCRVPIRVCPFWVTVGREMERRGHPFNIAEPGTDIMSIESRYVRFLLRPLYRGSCLERVRDAALFLSPTWRTGLTRVQARNLAFIETLRKVTGRQVVVDSSKIGIRLKYLLRIRGLDVRVVRLIRDGRAVSLTYMAPAMFADAEDPRLRGGGSGGSREGERLPIREAAREWQRSNEEAEAILRLLPPDRWIEIRYEDLCCQPDAVLGRIFRFTGVRTDTKIQNFRDREQHVIGNGMRLDTIGEIRLDERWRHTLTSGDLDVFKEVAGPMNRKLGYA